MTLIQSCTARTVSNSHSIRRAQSMRSETRLCHGGLGGGALTTFALTLFVNASDA